VKRRSLVAGLALVAGLVTTAPDVLAHGGGGTPGIDECDWSSFRNGLSNPGASSCDHVDIGNVATLRPQ
jgi:hypothetical protein